MHCRLLPCIIRRASTGRRRRSSFAASILGALPCLPPPPSRLDSRLSLCGLLWPPGCVNLSIEPVFEERRCAKLAVRVGLSIWNEVCTCSTPTFLSAITSRADPQRIGGAARQPAQALLRGRLARRWARSCVARRVCASSAVLLAHLPLLRRTACLLWRSPSLVCAHVRAYLCARVWRSGMGVCLF